MIENNFDMNSKNSFKLSHFPKLLVKTYTQWISKNPFRLSAVIAYYSILSLPALLIIIFNNRCDVRNSGVQSSPTKLFNNWRKSLKERCLYVISYHKHLKTSIPIDLNAAGEINRYQETLLNSWGLNNYFIKYNSSLLIWELGCFFNTNTHINLVASPRITDPDVGIESINSFISSFRNNIV